MSIKISAQLPMLICNDGGCRANYVSYNNLHNILTAQVPQDFCRNLPRIVGEDLYADWTVIIYIEGEEHRPIDQRRGVLTMWHPESGDIEVRFESRGVSTKR